MKQWNKMALAAALALCMLPMLAACIREEQHVAPPDNSAPPPPAETKEPSPKQALYDYAKLAAFHEKNGDYASLLAQLQVVKSMGVDTGEHQLTENARLQINIPLSLTVGEVYRVNQTAEMQDYIVLYALLDDLEGVEYSYSQDEYSLGASISRAAAQAAFGGEIPSVSAAKEGFSTDFIERLAAVVYAPDVKSSVSYEYDVMYKSAPEENIVNGIVGKPDLYAYAALYDLGADEGNCDYSNIVSQLQVGKNFPFARVEYHLNKGGNLVVSLPLELSQGEEYHVNPNALMQDCILLFVLLENLESVEYLYQQNEYVHTIKIAKEQAMEVFGSEKPPYPVSKTWFSTDFKTKLQTLDYALDTAEIISYDHT